WCSRCARTDGCRSRPWTCCATAWSIDCAKRTIISACASIIRTFPGSRRSASTCTARSWWWTTTSRASAPRTSITVPWESIPNATSPAKAAATPARNAASRGCAIGCWRSIWRRPRNAPAREQVSTWLPNPEVLDPERPIDPAKLTEQFIPPEEHAPTHRRLVLAVSMLVLLLVLAAAWKWTPMRAWLDVGLLSDYLANFRNYPGAPLLAIGAFIVGGLIVMPVTLMVVATALAFGPLQGFLYSLIGGVTSALLMYLLGRTLGRDTVRRFAGSRLNRLSRRLGERGVLAVALLRMLPVAPFTVVNLVAGASHIGLRDYLLGTLLGMGPGMLMIALFVDRVSATIQNPGIGSALLLAAVLALIFLGTYGLKRWVLQRKPNESAPSGA